MIGKRGAVMREGKALESALVGTLAHGSVAVFVSGGDEGRVKVSSKGLVGWVSLKVLKRSRSVLEEDALATALVSRWTDGWCVGLLGCSSRTLRKSREKMAKIACKWQGCEPPEAWRRSTVDWLKYHGRCVRPRHGTLDACVGHGVVLHVLCLTVSSTGLLARLMTPRHTLRATRRDDRSDRTNVRTYASRGAVALEGEGLFRVTGRASLCRWPRRRGTSCPWTGAAPRFGSGSGAAKSRRRGPPGPPLKARQSHL